MLLQTDFSDYALNAQPSDWTKRWQTTEEWKIQESGAIKVLTKLITPATITAISWDKIDGKNPSTILAKVRSTINTAIRLQVPARSGGTAAYMTGYAAALTSSNTLDLLRHDSNESGTTVTTLGSIALTVNVDAWYWIKFALDGSNLKVKAWQDGAAEPVVWGLEITDATYASGWTGISCFTTGAIDCGYFEVTLPPVPFNLTPDIMDPALDTIFAWDNDPGYVQTAYALRYKEKSAITWVTTQEIITSARQHIIPAETLTPAQKYVWQVCTWNESNVITEWSDIALFSTPVTFYFLKDPSVSTQSPQATHVIVRVRGTSIEASAYISPEPPVEKRIIRLVIIDAGTIEVCQTVANALINRWGREQKSVKGTIPLNVRLSFKDKVRVRVPQAGIDEDMTLQRKEHSITGAETSIMCGDIILGDSELIARIIDDLLK